MGETTRTRVILADDHAWIRKGIRKLLENTNDIEVIGEASNGLQALALVEDLEPDVLILDMEMPLMNGRQVAQQLQKSNLPVHVLVLSAYDDIQYILGVLNTGIDGYLTKDEAPSKIVQAVRGIANGQSGWFSKQVAAKIL